VGAEGEIRIRGESYNFSSLWLFPVTEVDTDTVQLSLADHDLQLFFTTTNEQRAGVVGVQSLFVSAARGILMLTRPN
jgi:hypothetical protein